MATLKETAPTFPEKQDSELLEFFATAVAISREKTGAWIRSQLHMARDVQKALLPAAPPVLPGYDVAAIHLPSVEVGGDYFDYIRIPGGRIGLVIADAAGNGFPAALLMATFRAALRTVMRRQDDVAEVAAEVNEVFLESTDGERFVTAVYGSLDPQTGCFDYVNCGHNYPLLLRASGESEMLHSGGIPLGLIRGAAFESARVTVREGDALVLYTDGVVEPADATEEEFGLERLIAELRSRSGYAAGQMVEAAVQATRAFHGIEHFEDDFTLVILKREVDDGQSSASSES